MPCCHSCIVTEANAASQLQRRHATTPFKGMSKLRKGFPLRPKLHGSWIHASAQDSNAFWEREEERWLREEERWRREEQRWLREEQRWNSERETWSKESERMKEEILSLRRQLEVYREQEQVSEKQDSSATLREVLLGVKGLLQTYNNSVASADVRKSAETSAGAGKVETIAVAEQSVESVKFILSEAPKAEETPKVQEKSSKQHRALKRGAEGDDVRMLQEALAKLGFYSGEEDMEYSSFSSGTDRAVKSWQASVGAPQDGIVTAQVLAQLVTGQGVISVNSSAVIKSSPESQEVSSTSVSETRVYLLGENRWEDPRKLLHRNQNNVPAAQKCFTCKGEGRTLCSECEGTGELNVEEQFLEWAGEGAKCPYCEGSGTLLCDDCDGQGVRAK